MPLSGAPQKTRTIARSLQPTIEESIRVSVQKNPKVLADAIFPLMGPGIRKAIASTIMGMIQSFSQSRAEVVRRFLIDNGNVNIAIMAVGMGSKSMADNLPDEHLRAGRRYAGFIWPTMPVSCREKTDDKKENLHVGCLCRW